MPGTRNWLLVAVTLVTAATFAGCGGDAFTSDAPDGGGTKDGGLVHVDASTEDASVDDGSIDDAQVHKDSGKDHGDDGGDVIGADAGPVIGVDAGPPCVGVCPSGFACFVGKCIDRATIHFSTATNALGNWTFGSRANQGATFIAYPHEWRPPATSIDFWGEPAGAIELSVFHNGTPFGGTASNVTVPAGALGFDPGGSALSVVRWAAPADGTYAIDVTYTGLSYDNGMVPKVGVGVIVGPAVQSSQTINAYGATNVATYSAASALLTKGTTIDFYVAFLPNMGDGGTGTAGATMLEAKISSP